MKPNILSSSYRRACAERVRMPWVFCLALAVALAGAASQAVAQTFPSKPITLVVPFPPGGSTDVVSRILAQRMSATLGQPIVVENRAGASGAIGMRSVAAAAADGYTLGVAGVGTSVLLDAFGRKQGYSPENDLVPVGHMGALGLVIAARPDFEAGNLSQLIALAKSKPGRITYGSSGSGTPGHLAVERLRFLTKMDLSHIPYKGNTPLLNDVVGRHVDLGALTMPGTADQIRAGMLKPIAVTSMRRSSDLPDVPTVSESGFPDYAAEIWNILVTPRGTPAAEIEKLNQALNAAINLPEVKKEFAAQSFIPVLMSPAETAAFVRQEREKWTEIVKQSGAKLD